MESYDTDLIIKKIADGDRESLKQVYLSMREKIYKLAFSILKNKQDAEDILHDTILCIYIKAKYYKGYHKGEQWILRIARNKAIDLYRKNIRQKKENIDDYDSTVCSNGLSDSLFSIVDFLKVLDLKERQIVMLHCAFDYTHKEISCIMKIPEGTVRRKYASSIKKISEHYDRKENSDDKRKCCQESV